MQTKSGFMDDRDESGEYRDYDHVGQTENKKRWGQIFITIRTQVVHANSDIDQDSLLFKHLNFSSCFTSRSHHNYHVLPLLLFPTTFRHWPSSGRPWHWVRRSFSKTSHLLLLCHSTNINLQHPLTHLSTSYVLGVLFRDAFKNYLADFFLTENCRKFSSKNGSKRAKIGVFWPKIAVF